MPKNPTPDQRIKWHSQHSRHCACREAPEEIALEVKKRQAAGKIIGIVPSAARVEHLLFLALITTLAFCYLKVSLFDSLAHVEIAVYANHAMYGEMGYFTSARFEKLGRHCGYQGFDPGRWCSLRL